MPSGYKPRGHTKIKNLLVTYIPLSQQIEFNQNVFDKNFTVYIPDRQDWKNNGIILNNDVVCFTDGSRFEQTGLSGAGVYNQTDGEEFILPLDRHTSVFQGGDWKRGTGKRGTIKNAGVENAGLENAGPLYRGWKMRDQLLWNAERIRRAKTRHLLHNEDRS